MKKIILSASVLLSGLAAAQNTGIGVTNPQNGRLEVSQDRTVAPTAGTAGTSTIVVSPKSYPTGSGPRIFNMYPAGTVDGHGFSVADGTTEIYTNSAVQFYLRSNRNSVGDAYISKKTFGIDGNGHLFLESSPTQMNGTAEAAQLLVRNSATGEVGYLDKNLFSSTNLYNADGTVTAKRSVNMNGNSITWDGGEQVYTNANAFRLVTGNKGMIFRNDGAAFYMLPSTDQNGLGAWTDDRPFTYTFDSKNVILNQTGGNVGIGVNPSQKLDVNGAFALVRGVANEQAYMGGDGAANDVQVGSLNPNVNDIAFFNATSGKSMNTFAANVTAGGTLTVGVTPDATGGEQVLVKGADNIVKQIPAATLASATEPWRIAGTNSPATANDQSIYQGGNVGIHTQNPTAPLDVQNRFRVNWNSPVNGTGISTSDVGGWARSYGFTSLDGTSKLGGFGGLGGPNTLDNLWIGQEYNKPVAVFVLSSKYSAFYGNVEMKGFDFMLGTGDQASRGNSGVSRALVKAGDANGSMLYVNYNNDFTAGTKVDSKFFIANTGGAVDAAADKVLVIGNNGEVKNSGSTLANIAAASEPWKVQGTSDPATLNNQHIYQTGNVMANEGALQSTMSADTGGQIQLINPTKTGSKINNWTIFNMTAGYSDGLNFWRYAADGTNAGPAVTFADSGNVGIGISNPAEKLDVAGNIRVASGARIYAPGRLHITGEETLYLLNRNGVIVSKSWEGNGNLTVEGQTKLFDVPAGDASQGILTRAADGTVSQVSAASIGSASEPWRIQGTSTPASDNNSPIYQMGSVAVGRNAAEAKLDVEGDALLRGRLFLRNQNGVTHHIFNYPTSANVNPLYLGSAKNSDGSKNDIILYNLSCNGDCNVPNIRLYANNTVASETIRANESNITGKGFVLSDDGDIVDNNDGYATMRFGAGVQVTAAANDNNVVHRLGANGDSFLAATGGNVGIGVTVPKQKLDVNGAYALIRGTGDEQAYIGGDGSGNDVQVGSLNPNVNLVSIYGASGMMNLAAKNTDVQGRLYVGDVQQGATSDNILVRGADGIVKYLPSSSFASTNIYNADGTLTGPRTVNLAGNTLHFANGPVLMTNNASALSLVGTDHQYIQWYPKGVAAGRKAYTGFSAANSIDFHFGNEAGGKFVFANSTNINGDLTVSGTIYQTSDAKFKQNVRTLQSGTSTIASLRPVSYTWNDAGVKHGGEANKEQIGFIAQEVEKVMPSAVQTDKDGNKSVNYSQVIPVLTKAVQELKAENDGLKARLDKLEALINSKK